MSARKSPDAIKCKCGHEEPITGYIAAHMDIELVGECKGCGRTNTVLRGRVIRSKLPKKK